MKNVQTKTALLNRYFRSNNPSLLTPALFSLIFAVKCNYVTIMQRIRKTIENKKSLDMNTSHCRFYTHFFLKQLLGRHRVFLLGFALNIYGERTNKDGASQTDIFDQTSPSLLAPALFAFIFDLKCNNVTIMRRIRKTIEKKNL